MKSAFEVIKSSVKNGTFEHVKEEIINHVSEFDINSIIVPADGKDYFFECASVIWELKPEIISPLAPKLMEWFQDLNWPGVKLIESKLRQLDERRLMEVLTYACEKASFMKDEEWLYNIKEVFDC